MTLTLSFLGAAGTVTGSRFLLETDGKRLLVDCGLFQGYKPLRQRNWAPFPVPPASIDAVVLTHAHLDHSGYLPLLVRNGFRGPIHSTLATRDLADLLLTDSGFINERDAEYANRHGFSKHRPADPLYTVADAARAIEQFQPAPFDTPQRIAADTTLTFRRAGHILGAAMVELAIAGKRLLFSGDLGRPHDPLMLPPAIIADADFLVVESTYGNRRHDGHNVEQILAALVRRTAERGGTLIVPAFAVGRAQLLLYYLDRLKRKQAIPDLSVYLDSPMAIDASDLFCVHHRDHRLSAPEARSMCRVARYVQSAEESKSLDSGAMPRIIVSASGMATGGRVLHHLKHYLPDPRAMILFTGFQAGGTRGADLLAGAREIRIHGDDYPVRAEIENLSMLSAHADADEILAWLGHFRRPPAHSYIVHGEPAAAEALRRRIRDGLGWPVDVADDRACVRLV
jgi:metallo-beta-lactamase family protein